MDRRTGIGGRADARFGTDQTPTREWQLLTYCTRLWGADRAGYVCVAIGHDAAWVGGRYTFRGSLRQRFVRWPDQMNDLVGLVLNESATRDVYVAPALRTQPNRQKSSAAPSRWLWADCDGEWTIVREAFFATVPSTRAVDPFRVLSGRGVHVYAPADDWLDPEVYESHNRLLARALDADHKWDSTTLLRPPGSFNWKPYHAKAGPAVPVILG